MHREDNSKYLLYIEPKAKDKLEAPIDDEYTEIMEYALSKAVGGSSGYSNKEDMGDGVVFMNRKIPSFHGPGRGYKGTHRTNRNRQPLNVVRDHLVEIIY